LKNYKKNFILINIQTENYFSKVGVSHSIPSFTSRTEERNGINDDGGLLS